MSAFISDIKSTHLSASGTVFGGRSRIKAIYVVPSATAGTIVIKNGGSSGTAVITINTPAVESGQNANPIYLNFPVDGVLCETSSYAALTNVAYATVFYG